MKLCYLSLGVVAAALASPPSISAQDFSLAARQADFSAFVHDFENSYAYLDKPEKPWLTWQARYAAAIENAQSQAAFDTVLASALGELHDFHAEVRSPVPNRWLPVPTFADLWAEFQNARAIVTAVRQGSDAERAGVRIGDTITAVGSLALSAAIDERLSLAVDHRSDPARQWALLSVLTGRADEARRITVTGRGGKARTVTLPIERHVDRPAGLLTSKTLAENIGLIRFNNSLGQQPTVAAFDAALAELRNTRGLILDLRDVPSGGNSSVALGIMGRFVDRLLPYQRHKVPNYGQGDMERNWIELVAPRGPFTYAAPVVILVDHWTGSMGEGVAIGFDAMNRGTVVGTAMAHLTGAVSDDKLPRTGVDVAYATEQLFHVNGTPREQWLPPTLVTELPLSETDQVLARGLDELSKALQGRSKPNP